MDPRTTPNVCAWGVFAVGGKLTHPLNYRYDILIPVGIVAAAIEAQWFGPQIKRRNGEWVDQWMFRWGDHTIYMYFIIALVAVVLLLRILELIRGIAMSRTSGVRLE